MGLTSTQNQESEPSQPQSFSSCPLLSHYSLQKILHLDLRYQLVCLFFYFTWIESYILGWPKSPTGFSVASGGKTQMSFLANPIYALFCLAFAGCQVCKVSYDEWQSFIAQYSIYLFSLLLTRIQIVSSLELLWRSPLWTFLLYLWHRQFHISVG